MRPASTASVTAQLAVLSPGLSRQLRLLALCAAVLAVCFAKPLFELARFSLQSELYSYIPLIPFVSFYLGWSQRHSLPAESRPNRMLAALLLGAGGFCLLSYIYARYAGGQLLPNAALAWSTLSFVLLFLGLCAFCLGRAALRALAFSLGLLLFTIPWPDSLETGFVSFLQHRSADATDLLFGLIGTPVLRQGVDFQLPGFSIQVAPECSGIRSTLVLIITSLVAAQMFLRSPVKRAILVGAVIPLGILRNAVRIVTLSELCLHVNPNTLDSDLHHKGGPLFFAVTLVPFLGLLYALRRLDLRKHKAP